MPRVALASVVVLAWLTVAAPAQAAPSTQAERLAAINCDGVPGAPKAPVLLIPGTGVTAEQNWSWGYARVLRDSGHGVCTVDPPDRSTVDVQDSVLYVRTAIEEVARRSGRRLSLVGHSQGAFHAVHVLRLFPELAPLVDDVIGLAGVYDRGSDAIRSRCAKRCLAPFWQIATGSRYMAALARRPLPAGPSYTAIGTLPDTVVTPQPAVNVLAGGRSVQIQDVCPGRHFADGRDHIYLAGDAVGHALAVDALDHPGTADPARVSPVVCLEQVMLGADLVKFGVLLPSLLATYDAVKVDAEPPLRCPLAPDCARVPALATVRFARTALGAGRPVFLRVNASRAGRLRLRVTGARPAVTRSVAVQRGAQTVSVPARFCSVDGRCRTLQPGTRHVVVQFRAAGTRGWTIVRVARLHILRRSPS